jgi:hypothetical protein
LGIEHGAWGMGYGELVALLAVAGRLAR